MQHKIFIFFSDYKHFYFHSTVERGYFVPPLQSASRLWRLSHHPATLQLPPPPPLHPSPEDIYLSSDRYLFGHPAVKLYRTPLYWLQETEVEGKKYIYFFFIIINNILEERYFNYYQTARTIIMVFGICVTLTYL